MNKEIIDYFIFDIDGGLKNVDEDIYIEYTENLYMRLVCYTKSGLYIAYVATHQQSITEELSDILSDLFLFCMFATGAQNILRYSVEIQ